MEPVWCSFLSFLSFLGLKHAFDFVPISIYFLQDHLCSCLHLVPECQKCAKEKTKLESSKRPFHRTDWNGQCREMLLGSKLFYPHKSGELSAISPERDALDRLMVIEEGSSAGG